MRTELERVREAGMAIDDEELARPWLDLRACSHQSGDVVAAVTLALPSARSPAELLDALGAHLLSAADGISARLGYRRGG